MALTGAVAAAVRKFDPYPRDRIALDFAGVATGGRPFYKRDGIIVPRFEMLRGAVSIGGAGFGTTLVNGVYRPFAPDAPVIGDRGLLVPGTGTEIVGLSCRSADAGWSRVGSVGAKTAGPTYKGIFQSARMASGGAAWHRLTPPASAFLAVTSGQLYTVIARYRAGTSGRVVIALPNSAGTNISIARGAIGGVAVDAQASGPLTLIETEAEGDGVIRTVLAWTPNFTGQTVSSGIGPDSTVVGEDVEVLGLSIQAGAYVGNPPIDNGNLAATRTASSPELSTTGLTNAAGSALAVFRWPYSVVGNPRVLGLNGAANVIAAKPGGAVETWVSGSGLNARFPLGGAPVPNDRVAVAVTWGPAGRRMIARRIGDPAGPLVEDATLLSPLISGRLFFGFDGFATRLSSPIELVTLGDATLSADELTARVSAL